MLINLWKQFNKTVGKVDQAAEKVDKPGKMLVKFWTG